METRPSTLIVGGTSAIGRAVAARAMVDDPELLSTSRRYAGQLYWDASKPDSTQSLKMELLERGVVLSRVLIAAGIHRSSALEEPEQLAEMLQVNVVGPFHLLLVFDELLTSDANVLLLSSNRASISELATTESLPYSISKAALNMLMRKISQRWEPTQRSIFSVHPGWVKSPMGGASAPLEPEDVAGDLWDLLWMKKVSTGSFIDRHGSEIPW